MALTDYNYRLKAMAGDTVPHDELGVSGDITGGTIALVDRGAGDMAWRFSGGQASVAIPAHTVDFGNASPVGLTIAITLKVVNYGTADFRHIVGIGPDLLTATSSGATTTGLHLARTSANNIRAVGKVGYTSATSVGAVERTYVVRISPGLSTANDFTYLWMDTVDRVGTDANIFANAGTLTGATIFDILEVNTNSGIIVEIKDFVVWNRQLSNAEAAEVADTGIRTAIDVSSDVTAPTMTGTMTSSAITSEGFTVDWAGTTRLDNVAITGYETSLNGTDWTSRGNVTSYAFTGLTANTAYTAYVRSRDLAGNVSTPALTLAVSTIAFVADTTLPVLTGAITPSLIRADGFTLSWPDATDNVSVAGYRYSTNDGVGYTDVGLSKTVTVSELTASTLYKTRVVAYDPSGNASDPPLTLDVTTLAQAPPAFTSKIMSNNTGELAGLYANTVFQVFINEVDTGALVVPVKTVTSNASGVLTYSDATCVRGKPYAVRYVAPNGDSGMHVEVPV